MFFWEINLFLLECFLLSEVYDKCTAQNGSNYLDVEGFSIGNNVHLLRKTAISSGEGKRRKGQGYVPYGAETASGGEILDTNNSNYLLSTSNSFHSQSKQQLSAGKSIDWKTELKRFYLSINMPNKVFLSTCRPFTIFYSYKWIFLLIHLLLDRWIMQLSIRYCDCGVAKRISWLPRWWINIKAWFLRTWCFISISCNRFLKHNPLNLILAILEVGSSKIVFGKLNSVLFLLNK